MTRKDIKRSLEIVRQLTELSRDGWANAKPCDYEPLERELREINKRGLRVAVVFNRHLNADERWGVQVNGSIVAYYATEFEALLAADKLAGVPRLTPDPSRIG